MRRIILVLVVLAVSQSAMSADLYDQQSGKYLGQLGGNPYSHDSTSNPYGPHGSQYSSDSINNPYGQYGSQYSNDSPNNPYATNPPAIIDNSGN